MAEDISFEDRKIIEKGAKATAILADPVFLEAQASLRTKYTDKWLKAPSPVEREECWALLRALTALVGELEVMESNATVATARTRRITNR